ncbi:S-layer homology domain-containing protein [Paenibacillus sp. YYML68]|uniref:S-layer homology domain-containing protein n=1 Tax=Paenibacillus sp. YYML68 TaxID=2909250 RepID=UPI0024919A2F|nr:S-layer homology domain-containing protein [Paenibacillus sp. YYML68]
MNKAFKRSIVSALTLAMVLGGSASAWADSDDRKGKSHDKGKNSGSQHNQRNSASATGGIKFESKDGKIEIKLSFDDLKGKDVEWAARYIASLASKQVFEGYEDGTFQPRKTITRIEAITAAVRLMGLREQAESTAAKQTNLNFSDAEKVKDKYPWAVGYVAVALENDLFAETDFAVQPEKEADRLWATTLLVKALKLQGEAKTRMNAQLPFKDENKIPAGAVGYVAVALEKKLIDGYEDNTFRPNQPVTRAELAALLDRTGNQLPDQAAVKGSVTAAVSSNIVQVRTANGSVVNIELDGGVYVFRNGTRVGAAELKAGDEVLIRTYNGKAIFIEVTKRADVVNAPDQTVDFTVNGTLNGYTLNSQGQLATISVNQAVYEGVQTAVYSLSSNLYISGDVSLLTSGRTVELRGKQSVVHTIIIK